MPGARKLHITRAWRRRIELAHGGRCCASAVLLARKKQNRPLHRFHRRCIIVVGKRCGTPDETGDRRRSYHFPDKVEIWRIGLDHLRWEPAGDGRLDQCFYSLLLSDSDTLLPLLGARRRRLA